MSRVFVTGVGVVSALGVGRAAFERGLQAGSPVRLIELSGRSELAALAQDFDPARFVSAKALDRMGAHAGLAVAAARLAVEDAGMPDRELAEAGLVLSGNYGDSVEAEARQLDLRDGKRVSPYHHARTSVASAAAWTSQELAIEGPGASLSTSSAAGAQAIAHGARLIRAGEVGAVLAGGAEARLGASALAGLRAAGVLSKRRDEPALALRPFDQDRDGTVPGEGAAVLVLESERQVMRRGVTPLAELAGWAEAMDAHHPYAPSPKGSALRRAARAAAAMANISTESVERVNAHGAGTRVGDAVEAAMIAELFPHRPAVTATKPLTGHLLGAAGAIEAAACVVGLLSSRLPIIAGLREPDEGVDLDLVRSGRECSHRVSLSLSHGFGGFATSLIFRRS